MAIPTLSAAAPTPDRSASGFDAAVGVFLAWMELFGGTELPAVIAAINALTFGLISGEGVPDSGLGDNGNFYINETNGDWYKKDAGAWGLTGNLTGPTGPAGANVSKFDAAMWGC
jgi:hypothetical protein